MEEINLKRLLEVTVSLKWIIAGMLVLMLAIGCLYTFCYVEPEYQSSIKLVLAQVVQNADQTQSPDAITQSDITMNNQLVSTYTEIIKSKNVLKRVNEALGLEITTEALSKKIKVTSVEKTQIMKITITDKNSELAQKIATELANAFKQEVMAIYKIDNVNIIDEAEQSNTPSNINHVKDIIIFEMLGIFLSCGIVLIIYLMDTTLKDEKDIETEIGVPSLGMLPLYKEEIDGQRSELLSFDDSKSPITECFRTLRTNLVFARNNKNLKNILVISSFSSEGKSYVAANLAMSFAKTNKKVIIVDADMRKGRQHTIFNIKNSKGLSNCLTKISKFDSTSINQIAKYVKTTEYQNIHLIPSGRRPANPLELISSDKMIELLSILNKIYDYVIIDGTPTNIVSDSVALSKYVDATVVVAEYKKTKIEAINKVKKSIENVGANITGIILNKCPITEKAYTDKYYYAESSEEVTTSKDQSNSNDATASKDTTPKTFTDLIQDIDFDQEEFDYEEVLNAKKEVSTSNIPEGNLVDYKLENISTEISSLKDIMLKMSMSMNDSKTNSYKKEIDALKKEIEELKAKLK
ncbi:MAG: polysaccharide biosynthesis tyrosine autokinase [Clostridia bacterium]|nr:polysaccharide biosynthesis tyrosine autokinase [Clostridia bacterium]